MVVTLSGSDRFITVFIDAISSTSDPWSESLFGEKSKITQENSMLIVACRKKCIWGILPTLSKM